jgi:hypothetical protein
MTTIIESHGNAIRWVIGSPDGPRSSTWRLWSNKKGDFYLSVRTLGGIVKSSFHRDGLCSIGFTTEYLSKARARFPQARSRHWRRWQLPDSPFARAVQVVIPTSELRSDASDEVPGTVWIVPPSPDHVVVTSVFIASGGTKPSWSGGKPQPHPIGVIATGNRAAWLLYVAIPLDRTTLDWIEQARAHVTKLPGSLDVPRLPEIRALVPGDRGEHDLFLIELAWSDPLGSNAG